MTDKLKLSKSITERVDKSFDKADDICIQLKQAYKKALDEIEKDVASFYMHYASDNGMTYAAATQYLSKFESKKYIDMVKDISKLLETKDAAFIAELNTIALKEKITRLEGLIASIKLELVKLESAQETKMHQHLVNIFTDNYVGAAVGIKGEVEAKALFSSINPTLIEETISFPWSGESFSNIIWGDTNKLAAELKRELTQGFIKGTSAHKMSSNLAKKMENSYKNAQRVVMTETAHVLNKASLIAYKDIGVEKVEFLAVLDKRTSSLCFNLNGDIIEIKDAISGKNLPPLHPHCRSTIIPVLED